MSVKKKTTFNVDWIDNVLNPQWSKWLRKVENCPYQAQCIVCRKIFCLSNMGKQAIRSHEESVKHKKSVSCMDNSLGLKNFFSKAGCSSKVDSEVISDGASTSNVFTPTVSPVIKNTCMDSFVLKENVLRAEIIWALKLISSHSSYNSFKDASKIFQSMFADSKIAEKLTVGSTKMSYLVCFGLAPYFSQNLKQDISDRHYVICFDEALNKISQKGQMDLIIRYWSTSLNRVSTRYLNSVFLRHSTANDLIAKFYEGVQELDLSKLLQISMDGPNVNLKMLRILKEDLATENLGKILDLGTCGLHVIHGALRTGHRSTKWDLNAIFRSLYQIFKDSPARRADFISVTGSNVFPVKFCEVRWLENVTVAERAIEIFPNIVKYIMNSTLSKTTTVEKIKQACADKLILAKMSFFLSVASILHLFLKEFQTSKPMAPFLYDAICNIIRHLLKRFIKLEIMESASMPDKFLKIDLMDKSNFCSVLKVDIGIAATAHLHKSNASDREKKEFRYECLEFLRIATMKIIERSSLNFPTLRSISSVDPKLIRSNDILSEKRMIKLLQILYENERITSIMADRAKEQFCTLCHRAKSDWKNIFAEYSQTTRLDDFYRELLCKDETFQDIWEVIKLLLTLSHGNASVESGFSVNKDMLVENLHERSLVSLRTVYDSVATSGGVCNVNINKDMLNHAKMARVRYTQFLDEQKSLNADAKNEENLKKRALAQIKLLKQKRMKLAFDTAHETQNIDSQIAELSKNL